MKRGTSRLRGSPTSPAADNLPSAATGSARPRILRDGWWPLAVLFGVVAALYGVGAELSWHSSGVAAAAFSTSAELSWQAFAPAVGFAFFAPAGVSVTAMVLTHRARWPVIVAAIVVAQLTVDARHGVDPLVALGLAGANVVEPLVGASLVLTWCRGVPDLLQRAHLTRFVAGACVLAPLVGGLLGATVGVEYAGIGWPAGVARWWAGDGLGVLVVGAPALVWPRQRQLLDSRRVEAAAVVVLAAVLSVAAFWIKSPPGLLLLPVLAWAAFRLEVIGAALTSAALAMAANYMTASGRGVFAAMLVPVPVRLAAAQLYIAVLMLVALMIGQVAAGRSAAVTQRQVEQRERIRQGIFGAAGRVAGGGAEPRGGRSGNLRSSP